MDDKFRSRKWRLAVFFSAADALLTLGVCLADHTLVGTALSFFAGAQAIILGLYGAANVMEKKNE
jgi:hypothetical protein